MVWIYDDPPYTAKEVLAYRHIKRKLKNKKFGNELIKLVSLYLFLKRQRFSNAKEIQNSAFYDKEKTRPIFDEKQARLILRALKQKGGDTHYPFLDTAAKGVLRDYTPSMISSPVGTVNGLITGTVDTLKDNIPFADLALEAFHGSTQLGVTTASNLGEAVAGPVGAVAVAPFTAVASGLASILSVGEGDLGGAIAHMATGIPILGIILSKGIEQGEKMAKVLKNHPQIAEAIPYMTEFHQKQEPSPDVAPTAGKRLSTMRSKSYKWKTLRKKSATH
jgi:hypothetical protein